jgi:predicted ArsR family transcriptional regulator
MLDTRQNILEYLRRHPSTIKELGAYLGLTSTGIRQHLAVLERDGLVEARQERGHVGRPALVFQLTAKGDALFPKMYDQLANAIIEEARTIVGPDSLQDLMRNVAARFAEPYMARLEGKTGADRMAEVAAIMTERGCVTEIRREPDGDYLVSEHVCLFANVANRDSAVCSVDAELLRLLTGAEPQQIASLLRGDNACVYRVHVNGAREQS